MERNNRYGLNRHVIMFTVISMFLESWVINMKNNIKGRLILLSMKNKEEDTIYTFSIKLEDETVIIVSEEEFDKYWRPYDKKVQQTKL